jgi:hypothetical protein
LSASRNELGFYLIQLPSDKIAALCVMHLMKRLFSEFALESKSHDSEHGLVSADGKEADVAGKELKVTALELFRDIGDLFERELKHSM